MRSRSRAVGWAVAAACAVGGAVPAAGAMTPAAAPEGNAAQICNGQWRPAPTRGLPASFSARSAKVLGANRVVLAGSTGTQDNPHAAIATWNGTTWSVARVPGQYADHLTGSSGKTLFADTTSADGTDLPVRFNGTTWTALPKPAALGGANGIVNAMASNRPGELWLAGSRMTSVDGEAPVIMHFTGGAWHTVANNLANSPYSVPFDLRFSPRGELWLVGEDVSSNADWSIIRTPYAGKLVGNRLKRVELPHVPGQVSTTPLSIAWQGDQLVVNGWTGSDDLGTAYGYSSIRSTSGRWSVQARPALTTGGIWGSTAATVGRDVWSADDDALLFDTDWAGLSRLSGDHWTDPQAIGKFAGYRPVAIDGTKAGQGWMIGWDQNDQSRSWRICGSPSTSAAAATDATASSPGTVAARPAAATAGPRTTRVPARPAYGPSDGLPRRTTTGAVPGAGKSLSGPAIARLRTAQTRTATPTSYVAADACAKPKSPNAMRCMAKVVSTRSGGRVRAAVTGIPVGYGPADFRAAYKLPKSGGKGRTIAIVDAYGYPSLAKDLAVYRKAAGLPACTVSSKCLTIEGQTGGKPPTNVDQGWALEQALDVDAASAACPDCKILVVQARSTSDEDLAAANRQAAEARPFVISNSFGRTELTSDRQTASATVPKGTPLVASTGDVGLLPSYPATVPSVIGVGGSTLLETPGTKRGWSEHLWSLSGGGCSAVQPKPAFQRQSFCMLGRSSSVAVVADADPASGAAVYDSAGFQGQTGWFVVGGTSLAAPLTAGMYAVRGIKPSVAKLWSGAQATNPVTGKGTNGWCAPKIECTASAHRYSGASGWGSLR